MMKTRWILMTGLLTGLALASCATDPKLVDEFDTLTEELNGQAQQIAELQEQVHVLSEASRFDMAVAQYLLDSAGLHAIDDALNEGGQIDPGYTSRVERLYKVLGTTSWPESLELEAMNLLEKLEAFRAALADDDQSTAAALAAEVHELQHSLSHNLDAWLGGEDADHGHDE